MDNIDINEVYKLLSIEAQQRLRHYDVAIMHLPEHMVEGDKYIVVLKNRYRDIDLTKVYTHVEFDEEFGRVGRNAILVNCIGQEQQSDIEYSAREEAANILLTNYKRRVTCSHG